MELHEVEVAADLIHRARALDASVVILPVRDVDGLAVYPEATVTVVKELRSVGVDAHYLDGPERRIFEVKKSGLEVAVGTLLIGVASAAAWDAVKALLLKLRGRRLSVTYVDLETPNEKTLAWCAEGDAESVLDAIDRLRGQ
jgi:hypothetical protein